MNATQVHRIIIFCQEGLARECLTDAFLEYSVVPIWVGRPEQCSLDILNTSNPIHIIICLESSIESELEPYAEYLSQETINVIYEHVESISILSTHEMSHWARKLAIKILKIESPLILSAQELAANSNEDVPEFDSITLEKKNNQLSNFPDEFISDELNIIFTNSETDNSKFNAENYEQYNSIEIDSDKLNEALEILNQSLSNSCENEDSIELNCSEIDEIDEIDELESSAVNNELLFESDFHIQNKNTDLDNLDFNNKHLIDTEDALEFMSEDALKLALNNLNLQLSKSTAVVSPIKSNELELQLDDAFIGEANVKLEEMTKAKEYDLSKYTLVSEEDENNSINSESQNFISVSKDSMFLIISGIGGPGVVRTILSNIKNNFEGILVLSQSIEASKLPKFLIQLQKIISVKIVIAETDEYLLARHIYIMPENHTIRLTSLGYQCIKNSTLADFLMQKLDKNVQIVVLSGADVNLAQSLIQINQFMNNIHIQPPEECFDAALPQLLANIGVPKIRNEILETWFN